MSKWNKNGKCRIRWFKCQAIVVLSVILFCMGSIKGMAAEEVLSVELPILTEEDGSPFDFFLDPYGLLYKTGAAKYGGGSVEEGATLLFKNKDGEYDFSGSSDFLTVENQGERSVTVTVTAALSDFEGMNLVPNDDFSGSGEPDIYLALADDWGNVQTLSEDGNVSICQEVAPGTWSVRLVGSCNPDADWQSMVSVFPKVSVTWHTDSVPEIDEQAPDAEKNGTETENEPETEETDSTYEGTEDPSATGEETMGPDSTEEQEEEPDSTGEEAGTPDSTEEEKPAEPTEGTGESDDAGSSVSGNDMAAGFSGTDEQKNHFGRSAG